MPDWSKEIPKKSGWYWVKWLPGSVPSKVLVWHGSSSDGLEEYSTWAYDETDDSECLVQADCDLEGTLWQPVL